MHDELSGQPGQLNESPPVYGFRSREEHVARLRQNPLGQLRIDLLAAGMAPQLAVAELVYLVKASGYAGRPTSAQVRGPSEAGKSTMVRTVIQMHPQEDRLSAVDITWASLMDGAGQGRDLRRTVIHLDENVEARKSDARLMAAFRELTTSPHVTRVKQVRGVSQRLTLLGPAVVIDTMLTDTRLTYQDASRFLCLSVDDDLRTQQLICRLNQERFEPAGQARICATEKITAAHRLFLQSLRKDLVVYKPPGLIGTGISVRFDSAVFGLVCTAAWLNQANRTIGADNEICATVEDYTCVWSLLQRARILAPNSELSHSAQKILKHWQRWANDRGDMTVTTSELREQAAPTMNPDAFTRILKELRIADYAAVVRQGPRGQFHMQLTPLGESWTGCDLVGRLQPPDSLGSAQPCAAERRSQVQKIQEVTSDLHSNGGQSQ